MVGIEIRGRVMRLEDCVVRLKTARMSRLKLQLTAVQNLARVLAQVQARVPAHSLPL